MYCPHSPDEWKRFEKLRTKWNVHHAVGALVRKHVAMKKPKKSGSDYYKHKDFFSLVLLDLVDAEHKFLWSDCESSGSSSSAQIFNRSDLMEKTKDGSWGFRHLNQCEREGHICTTSCWVTTPLPSWQKTTPKRTKNSQQLPRERIAMYRIFRQRQEGGGKHQFRVLLLLKGVV